MKRLFTLLLSIIVLSSCSKKEDEPQSDKDLRNFAASVKIEVRNLWGESAELSIQGPAEGFQQFMPKLTYQAEGVAGSAKELTITDINNVKLTGLTPGTKYAVQIKLSNGSQTQSSSTLTFTTPKFSINYTKFYDRASYNSDYYRSPLMTFSLEGGVHTIYGKGFNEQANTVSLIAKDNPATVINLPVTVVSNEVITVKVPSDIIPEEPYVDFKHYYLKVNNEVFRSYEGTVYDKADTAIFKVFNKDIKLDGFRYFPDGRITRCPLMIFDGRALNTNIGVSPDMILGMQAIPVKREIVFYRGTSFVTSIDISINTPAACESGSVGLNPDYLGGYPKTDNLLYFNEVRNLNINTALPSGSYTATLHCTMADGQIIKSNSLPISF